MAKNDTKTEQMLDVLGNGGSAAQFRGCCNTKTQSYILDAIDRVQHLEDEIEEMKNNPDVVDIVATYADLADYDTSGLTDKDIIRVLIDETHGGSSTYYRWDAATSEWTFIGISNTKEVHIGDTAPQDSSVLWVDTSGSSVVDVTGVSLNKQSSSIAIGSSETLTATIDPNNATNKNVTWSKTGDNITIVPNGLYCAVTGVGVGSGDVTVTTEDGSFTDTCSYTVTPIAVTGVTLNESSKTITSSETFTLTATIAPNDATDQTVTWSKTGSNISISPNGLSCVVSATGDGNGSVTVTTNDGSYTATCAVIVSTAVPVTGVELDQSIMTILEGETKSINAVIAPANATNQTVTWTASTQDITLTPSGLTCVVEGITEGSATITVTTQDGSFTDTCDVTIEHPEVPSGYTKVQYLKGSGTQYIDLGFKPHTGIVAKGKFTGFTQPEPVGISTPMGVMTSASNRFDLFSFGSVNYVPQFGLGYIAYNFTGKAITQGQVYEVEAALKNGEQYLKVDNETVYTGTTSGSITASYNMYMFNRIKNGSMDTGWYEGKIYYVQIWQDDVLIRDLVPCLDDQNVPCFYDKVNDYTYYNAGSGTFIYE